MVDLHLEPHNEKPYHQKVIMGGDHIANIEHRLRIINGGPQPKMDQTFTVHPPEHNPEHFNIRDCDTIHKAKMYAMMASLSGDLKKQQ